MIYAHYGNEAENIISIETLLSLNIISNINLILAMSWDSNIFVYNKIKDYGFNRIFFW